MEKEIFELVNWANLLHQRLEQKCTMLHKETQTVQPMSGIFKMPKAVLIRIFMFLEFRTEVPAVVETCKMFNSLIASRPFQITLYRLTTDRKETKKEKTQEEVKHTEADMIAMLTKDEILARIKKTKAINNMLVAGFQKSEEKLKDMLKTISKINDEMRIQRQINAKTIKMKDGKESEYLELSKQIRQNNLLISNCTHDYTSEITLITSQIKKIEADKQELNRHIKVLQVGLQETRQNNGNLLKRFVQFRENLGKLKNYANDMMLPKVKKIENK